MTSGDQSGTSGASRALWGPWATIALIGVAVAVVTATSDMMELARSGSSRRWWEPAIWEATSAAVIIATAPLVGWAMRRWPPRPGRLVQFGAIQLAATIPFSLIHILAIFVTRESIYWAIGRHYGFFDDGVALTVLYEWRKDVLTYAAIAATYWAFDYAAARRAAAPAPAGDGRIEIRDGGVALFLAPAEVLWVEAAGNYIEFHTGQRSHLVRGTLAAWEARLAAKGFVRVHRSRLVNRARISAIRPTPSGDVEITLDDGRNIAGSRRYREALEGGATIA